MMRLPPGWYVCGSLAEFPRKKPTAVRRFGVNWVVWRTSQGQWVAQEDRCPHRSAKLSLGRIQDDRLTCPFHGFEFDHKGVCAFVPEIRKAAAGIRIQSYELRERHGFLWFPWKTAEIENNQRGLPWFEDLGPKLAFSSSIKVWKQSFSRCVENQLDYAHLPFVHATSIGRGFDPSAEVRFHLDEEKLHVDLGDPTTAPGFFEFRFPNIWQLHVSKRMKQFLAFVPVDENETRIYVRAYQGSILLPGLSQLIAWLMMPFNSYILSQDHHVVIGEEPRDALKARYERLMPSDRAIRAFREWLSQGEISPSEEGDGS
jgi:phenylpropionate dioxygenase-like ring-hydroxylating dioxygenase large terminal subunit